MIYNRDLYHQTVVYDALVVGAMDIDLASDLYGRGLLFVEFKAANKQMNFGQELCYKRIVESAGLDKPSLLVLSHHHTDNPEEDVDAGSTIVSKVIYRWPTMKTSEDFTYQGNKPTLNEFISDLAYVLGLPRQKLKEITDPWEALVTDDADETESATQPVNRGLFNLLYQQGLIHRPPWERDQ